MTTEVATEKREYEVMLLASQAAAATLGELLDHINEVFTRADADVIAMRKWDERRLAYEIDKQKRGVYFLAYIMCSPDQVARIERDVAISQQLLRVLITKADHLTREEMDAHEGRQALADEAKMKGSEAASAESSSTRARIGAPEQPKADEAPADDAQAESSGDGPNAEDDGDEPKADA
ncbi:MAG: 30S ribosomal protein S6 [Phycisphaerales bacterium]